MEKQHNNINNCILLLSKPFWSNQDIMEYVGCKTTRASQIRQEALKHGGVSRLYPQKTKRDAIFKVLELDYKEELIRLKILKEEKVNV
jgi:hypothetical protein